jgi:hypothetical protein
MMKRQNNSKKTDIITYFSVAVLAAVVTDMAVIDVSKILADVVSYIQVPYKNTESSHSDIEVDCFRFN